MRLSEANKFFPQSAWRRSFFVTLFFVTLAAALFWIESYRAYEAEMRVLIIGKSPSAATDQVVENFSELTSNLSFYERVLAGNDLINDDFEGYSQDQRKALWNETVTVTRSKKSGVLIVTAKQETKEQAKRLVEETVRTLFSVAGFYYNIKTDIDLRVVDETIVKPVIRHPFRYGVMSFGSALGLTALFFALLSLMPSFFGRRSTSSLKKTSGTDTGILAQPHQDFAIGSAVPFIDPRKFVPARPKALSFESSHEEQQIREEIIGSVKAAAPANLPMAAAESERSLPGMDAESLPFEFEDTYPEEGRAEVVSETVSSREEPLPSMTKEPERTEPVSLEEPTIEEYKRRLNELLSGGK